MWPFVRSFDDSMEKGQKMWFVNELPDGVDGVKGEVILRDGNCKEWAPSETCISLKVILSSRSNVKRIGICCGAPCVMEVDGILISFEPPVTIVPVKISGYVFDLTLCAREIRVSRLFIDGDVCASSHKNDRKSKLPKGSECFQVLVKDRISDPDRDRMCVVVARRESMWIVGLLVSGPVKTKEIVIKYTVENVLVVEHFQLTGSAPQWRVDFAEPINVNKFEVWFVRCGPWVRSPEVVPLTEK
jgi:hypothetical protein